MSPDFSVLKSAICRDGVPSRVPLYEHFVDYEIQANIMGWSPTVPPGLEFWRRVVEFHHQMGYDYVPMESGPRFSAHRGQIADDTAIYGRGSRGWVDEHAGPIQTREDMEAASWPSADDAFDYETFAAMASLLPEGMKIVGGCSGGPFEHASFLMGLEGLSMLLYEDEAMAEELFFRVGTTLVAIAERVAPLDCIGAYRFGDDLGYKGATMISPKHLRKYVFPWQRKVVEAVHKAGKPFVLHSCGNLSQIMDDLIDDVGIDAKHSFEDVITPAMEAKALWGDRVAILGGVDVDFLARRSPEEIREHTLRVLEVCAPGGGFALGSGNTIANYIPVPNYLAMVNACAEFNGR